MRLLFAFLSTAFTVFVATNSASAAMCIRLSLSDVAFSKPAISAAARERLNEYAVENFKTRGWSGKGELRSKKEKISCETYLDLDAVGVAYRCRVTATFCTMIRKNVPTSAIGRVVKLRLKGSSFEISGVLKKFDKVNYVIAPPNSNDVTVPAGRFDCVGNVCPKAAKRVLP